MRMKDKNASVIRFVVKFISWISRSIIRGWFNTFLRSIITKEENFKWEIQGVVKDRVIVCSQENGAQENGIALSCKYFSVNLEVMLQLVIA